MLKELQTEARGIPRVQVARKTDGLRLSLDFQRGLEGYESVRATSVGDNYDLIYTGLFGSAFDTFSVGNLRDIQESQPLSKLMKKVQKIKEEGRVKVFDQKREEVYAQLISLEEKGVSYDEAERAIRFFFDVFVGKAKLSA